MNKKRAGAKKARSSAKANNHRPSLSPSEYADLWRREAARREAQDDLIERDFAGVPCVVRRLDIQAWTVAGRIPDFLAVSWLEAEQGKRQHTEAELTPEEFKASLKFQKDVVCSAFVRPKIVARDVADEGEIAYADFAINFSDVCKEVIKWELAGCPDIPVRTEGGEVSVNDLKNFPDRQGASGSARSDG